MSQRRSMSMEKRKYLSGCRERGKMRAQNEKDALRLEAEVREEVARSNIESKRPTRRTYQRAKAQPIDALDSISEPQHKPQTGGAVIIGPQPGPQTAFLSTSADIAVYGGSAGGGKSYSLLLDPLRYVHHPHFGAVLFRRTYPEIKKEGGLWDEATKLYLPQGARARESDLSFTFPSGAVISFAHLQYEKNIFSWQGAQVPYFGFDELTHFSSRQFWYLMSRQRNVAGIPNLIRCTCNPDPDSFVRRLIDWWIDKDGYAIPERSGVIRWFIRREDEIIWANTKQQLIAKYGKTVLPKSFTFIRSSLQDNKILMDSDPSYLATLESLPKVDRERLLSGNWNIRPAAGLYFKRTWFEVIEKDALPPLIRIARGWDLAGTEKDKEKSTHEPAATAGVKMARDVNGNFYILDLRYDRVSPLAVERMIKNCAMQDGVRCKIRLPQDPGQAGKAQVAHFVKILAGYEFRTRIMTGDKVTRAGPFSSMCEYGRVKVVKGPWNETWFNHLEEFPPEVGSPDIVDAAVEAFHELTSGSKNVKNVKPVSITVQE